MESKIILNSLGIPENNKNLKLQEIIDNVLKKNHPDVPEMSDISDTKLSMIDDSKKAVITLLNMEAPPFYSNIIVMAANEQEDFCKSFFRKITLKKRVTDGSDEIVVSADFYIPMNEKLEQHNYDGFFKEPFISIENVVKNTTLDLLIRLVKVTKGLMSVTVNRGQRTIETISIYDVLDYIQKN